MTSKSCYHRGVQVSHETLRQWNTKFAPLLTEKLRHREPRRGSRWFLDEVCIEIGGKKLWLWRAVDDSGAVLDLLLQDRRDTHAAKSFLGRLFVNYDVPDVIHTDKLWSYGAAIRELPVLRAVEHVQVLWTARCNNLIEQSYRPTRKQERSQLGFKKTTTSTGIPRPACPRFAPSTVHPYDNSSPPPKIKPEPCPPRMAERS